MGRTSHSLCLLFLISIPTLIILGSHLMDLKSMPKDKNSSIQLGFRLLLSWGSSSMTSLAKSNELERHGLSFAPAPAPIPLSHTHTFPRSPPPLHRRGPSPPAKVPERGRRDDAKLKGRRIITVVAASVGAILVVIGVIMVLVCLRSRRNRRKRIERTTQLPGRRAKATSTSSATSKVNSDHGLGLLYLNSQTPFQETANNFKPSSEFKNVMSNESKVSSAIHNVRSTKVESDSMSLLAEDIRSVESVLSDDESFYSACNSHSSSAGAIPNLSVANLSNSAVNHSPFNSSNCSNSPYPRTSRFSLAKSLMESQESTHLNLSKPPCSSLQNLEKKITLPTASSKPQDREFQGSSHSSPRISFLETNQPDIPTLAVPLSSQMAAVAPLYPSNNTKSSQHVEQTSSHSNQDAFPRNPKPAMHSSHPSKPLGSMNISKPPQPPLVPLVCNESILRPPPPPPLPPSVRPPLQKWSSISHRPPPPPPSQFQQCIPVGKDGIPLPKLKPLHWDKVRAVADRSMVWDKIRCNSFEFDEEMIGSLFGYNIQSSIKTEELKNKSSSSSKHVLEPKRLQNFTILLKALNATSEQVCDALVQGSGLSIQQLEGLVKMVPTREEAEKLSTYEGDVDQLDSAEIFMKTILRIPYSFSRIETMLYRETFEDEVVDLRKSFATLEEACKELRCSQLFIRLLEAVLRTGNRMNVGTIRGGARAFKLGALLKLADVKGTDGKTTLLHFVVQEMMRSQRLTSAEMFIETGIKTKLWTSKETEESSQSMVLNLVSELGNELSNVKKAANMDLDVLTSSVCNLSDGLSKLKQLIEEHLSTDESSRIFLRSMKSFMNHAEKIIKELRDGEGQVLRHVREITEYYHGNLNKDEAHPLQIFVIIRDFLCMLDQVCKELRSLKNHQSPYPGTLFH